MRQRRVPLVSIDRLTPVLSLDGDEEVHDTRLGNLVSE